MSNNYEDIEIKKAEISDHSDNSCIRKLIKDTVSMVRTMNVLVMISQMVARFRARRSDMPPPALYGTISKVKLSILLAFKAESDSLIENKRVSKHLVTLRVNGVWMAADRSFRARNGVPIVDGRTDLGKAIIHDLHESGGHLQDV